MGVKVQIIKPELHPVGDYVLQITGNEQLKNDPNKVAVQFVIAQGPLTGKRLSRVFPKSISNRSHLGDFLLRLGIQSSTIQSNEFDLDVLNGTVVVATLTHFPAKRGLMNSIDNFRKLEQSTPIGAPVASVPPAAAPVQLPLVQQSVPSQLPSKPLGAKLTF